jgi:hypothetical protein
VKRLFDFLPIDIACVFRLADRLKAGVCMSYFKRPTLAEFFREVYSSSEPYLGSIYLNTSARKWAIKEYPGQWFDTEDNARGWLVIRNEPTSKG